MTPDPTTLRPCPRCRAETEHVARVRWDRAYTGQPRRLDVIVCVTCAMERPAPETVEARP